MAKLNKELLMMVKQGFIPMPGGMAEPVAGAGPMTAGMAAPMGGGAPPMDPAMMGGGGAPPMDPAMMGGGMPADPAMAGGDPAMMGAEGAPPTGQIVMTPEEFARVLQVVASMGAKGGEGAGAEGAGGEAKPKKLGTDGKLDLIAQAIGVQFPQEGAEAGGAPQ